MQAQIKANQGEVRVFCAFKLMKDRGEEEKNKANSIWGSGGVRGTELAGGVQMVGLAWYTTQKNANNNSRLLRLILVKATGERAATFTQKYSNRPLQIFQSRA
jgi:hypothetical protein